MGQCFSVPIKPITRMQLKKAQARKFELWVCGLTREKLNEFSSPSLSGSSNLWVSFQIFLEQTRSIDGQTRQCIDNQIQWNRYWYTVIRAAYFAVKNTARWNSIADPESCCLTAGVFKVGVLNRTYIYIYVYIYIYKWSNLSASSSSSGHVTVFDFTLNNAIGLSFAHCSNLLFYISPVLIIPPFHPWRLSLFLCVCIKVARFTLTFSP